MPEKDQALPTRNRRRRRRHCWACLLLAAATLCLPVAPADAVPIPFKNCGKAGDILTVNQLDASVWPPPTAAPLTVTATIDPVTGQVSNLHAFLLLGVSWMFDSGSLPTSLNSGFVTLPPSVPVSVTSPPLPVAAGPYDAMQTFTASGGASVTVVAKANVGQSIVAPITTLTLTFNGTPGFPVRPVPGSYEARVQMTLPGGAGVFCFDQNLTDVAFVTAVAPAQIPTLSYGGLLALLLLVGGLGFLALLWRALDGG